MLDIPLNQIGIAPYPSTSPLAEGQQAIYDIHQTAPNLSSLAALLKIPTDNSYPLTRDVQIKRIYLPFAIETGVVAVGGPYPTTAFIQFTLCDEGGAVRFLWNNSIPLSSPAGGTASYANAVVNSDNFNPIPLRRQDLLTLKVAWSFDLATNTQLVWTSAQFLQAGYGLSLSPGGLWVD